MDGEIFVIKQKYSIPLVKVFEMKQIPKWGLTQIGSGESWMIQNGCDTCKDNDLGCIWNPYIERHGLGLAAKLW